MSYHPYFALSTGLAKPIRVPKGTLQKCLNHVARVESILGFETTQYLDNPPHWKSTKPKEGVTDEVLCQIADEHNHFVRYLYEDLAKWSKTLLKAADSERLTPKDAARFWHGLQTIAVPPERWTRDYYRGRMEHLYEVMRGNSSEGVSFNDKKALTPKQAAAVVCLFSEYLDKGDLRLDVPNGLDRLKSSYDGGYTWCEKCGPIDEDDLDTQAESCPRRECPIKEEYGREVADGREA